MPIMTKRDKVNVLGCMDNIEKTGKHLIKVLPYFNKYGCYRICNST